MRLRGVSEEGEKLDGLVPSLEKKFNKFGLSLKKDDSTFKSTFEILKDVASIQNEITDMEKADLLESVSGKRGAQTIAAIIQNMETAIDVSQSFDEAQGSAMREHEKYMQGVEYASNKLEGTLTQLRTKLLESSTLIKSINMGNDMLENVAALGKFSVILAGATIALSFFALANKKAMASVEGLTIATQVGGVKKLGSDILLAGRSLLGFKTSLDGATISATALNVATGALLLGIPLLIQGLGMVANHQNRVAEATRENVEAFSRQSDMHGSLDSLINSYEELAGKSTMTAKEQEKLLKIKEQIKDLLPQATNAIDNENMSLENQIAILKDLNDQELEALRIKAQKVLNKGENSYEKDAADLEKALARRAVLMEQFNKYSMPGASEAEKNALKGVVIELERSSVAIADLTEKTTEWESASKIMQQSALGLERATHLQTIATSTNKDEVEASTKVLLAHGFTQEDINSEIEKYIVKVEDATESEFIHQQSLEELTETFNDITSKIQTYNVFLSEINSKEGLSTKSKQDIIVKHQELLPYIDSEIELRNQLMTIIKQEEDTQLQAYKNMMMVSEDYFNVKVKGNAELVNKLKEYYGVDLENVKTLAQAKELVETNLIKSLSQKWGKFYRVVGNSVQVTSEYESLARGARMGNTDAQKIYNEMHAERMKFENMGKSFDNLLNDTVFKGAGASLKDINMGSVKDPKKEKKKKEEYKAEADAYTKINLELDRNNVLLQLNKVRQEAAGDDIAKKIALMEEEIELNKERQDLLHQYNTQMREDGKSLQKELSSIFKFEGSWDDNSMIITNMDAIEGKSKEVEEKFKRVIAIMGELPKGSQEWANLNNQIQKINLDKLIASFELANQKFKAFDDTLNDLAYDLKMLDTDDFDGHVNNSISVIDTLNERVKQATLDLEALGTNGFKEGTKEAKEFANQQDYLSKIIKDGTLSIVEQERALSALIKQQREKVRTDWIAKENKLLAEQRDRLQALESIQEAIVQIIRKRGEEEKKALDEAHRAEIDSLEERHKERKKAYQNELDEFKKMIQGKIDALDDQYAEEDYLEELDKEREKATEIQKQIDVLSLDDSLTARNKVIGLRKQLADQNERIAKMQQKKERDLLKKSLQEQLKDKEKDASEKENIADKIYENEKKRLEEDYKINKEHLDRKYSDEKVYAEARESIMRGTVETSKGMFEDIYDAYQDFEDKFGKGMGILGDIIKKDFLDQLEKAQQAIRDLEYTSRPRDDYDSGYDPGDDEIGWKDPKPDKPSSGGSGGSSNNNNNSNSLSNMTRGEYEEYKTNKKLYEDAKKKGAGSPGYEFGISRKQRNDAIRSKYGISSDAYSYDDLKNVDYSDLKQKGYKKGGETRKTGLHFLDGLENEPERVLSGEQTKGFNKLVFEDMPKLQGMLKTFDASGFQDVVLSAVNVPRMPILDSVGGVGGNKYDITFDIKGNMDRSIFPEVQKMITSTIEKTQENKISKWNDIGIKRPLR